MNSDQEELWSVYAHIMQETLVQCRSRFNAAVLQKVRERWQENLQRLVNEETQKQAAIKHVKAEQPPPQKREVPSPWEVKPELKEETLPASPAAPAAAAEEEEEWGEWEDPSVVPKERVKSPEPVVEVIDESSSVIVELDERGREVPKESDFATRITTQYGRTHGLGTVQTANALHWDNPDEVDSDMDDISELSDEEPSPTDPVIAAYDSILRPVGKKTSSNGVWKVKLKNGVARVAGREYFFDTFYAELEF